jgi:DNA-binding CsgD family transcriptional regulator
VAGVARAQLENGSFVVGSSDERGMRSELAPKLTPQPQARHSHDPAKGFAASALSTVTGLVPCLLGLFWSINPRGEVGDGVVLERGPQDEPIHGGFYTARVRALDPFAPRRAAHSGVVLLTVDDIGPTLFAASPYGRALDAAGLGDQVSLYLRAAGAVVGMVELFRGRDGERFSAADVRTLRQLQPLVEHGYAHSRQAESPAAPALPDLTRREAEVAALIALGASNADIAAALTVAQTTVKTHLTQIYAKFGVRSRTQLALRLREQGIDDAVAATG